MLKLKVNNKLKIIGSMIILNALLVNNVSANNIKAESLKENIIKDIAIVESQNNIEELSELDEQGYIKEVFRGCGIKVNDKYVPLTYINNIKFASETKPYILRFTDVDVIYPIPTMYKGKFLEELTKNKMKCKVTRRKQRDINIVEYYKLNTVNTVQ